MKVAIPTALATLLAIWSLVEEGRTTRRDQLLHQLPSTAKFVVRVDVPALEEHPSALAVLHAFAADDQLSVIEVECGIDPRAALDELVIWAGGPDDQPFQTVGLLITGRDVDAETFAECFQTLVEARGSEVTRLPTTDGAVLGSTDGRSALAEVNARTIVTGSSATVAEFLAVERGVTPSLVGDLEFRSVWARVSEGALAGVFVAPVRWRDAIARVGAINDQTSALAGVKAVGLTTARSLPDRVTVLLDVEDEDVARRDAALIEVWAESRPETIPETWHDVVRSADIETKGPEVRVALDLTGPLESLE